MRVLAIDIGGSSIKHAIVEPGNRDFGDGIAVARTPLPSLRFEDLRAIVRGVVDDNHGRFDAIGISTSGSVDATGKVISAGHFDGYANVLWTDELLVAQDVPVVVANDGRAAAWGEYEVHQRLADTHVHVVLGTGVGGGIVHRGELLIGDSGQAGYIGHIRVTEQPTLDCSCGRQGHVESLASEPGICSIYASEVLGSEAKTLNEVLQGASGPHAAEISRTLIRAGHGLGAGLGAVLNVLNPAVITIGGGVALALHDARLGAETGAEVMMHAVRAGMRDTAHKRPFAAAEVSWGQLGNNAGIVGAALLAEHAWQSTAK